MVNQELINKFTAICQIGYIDESDLEEQIYAIFEEKAADISSGGMARQLEWLIGELGEQRAGELLEDLALAVSPEPELDGPYSEDPLAET